MTIRYHGRMLPCFLQRNGCEKHAEYRVETKYNVVHVCGDHQDFLSEEGSSVTELAPLNGEDVIYATSLGSEELRSLPHIIEVTEES